jgi:hypothetical protein
MPMPGAITIGFFAYTPMAILLNALTRTVAVKIPSYDIPVLEIIDGFTTMMYIVARNEVMPAIILFLDQSFDFQNRNIVQSFVNLSQFIES